MWQRGNSKDYDEWAMEGWSYENVLPYFKKAEHDHREGAQEKYHGFDGPIHVSHR